jgi:hypothetical protein
LRHVGAHFSAEEEEEVAIGLTKAACNGDLVRLKLHVECGGDLNWATQDQRTALHLVKYTSIILGIELLIGCIGRV